MQIEMVCKENVKLLIFYNLDSNTLLAVSFSYMCEMLCDSDGQCYEDISRRISHIS